MNKTILYIMYMYFLNHTLHIRESELFLNSTHSYVSFGNLTKIGNCFYVLNFTFTWKARLLAMHPSRTRRESHATNFHEWIPWTISCFSNFHFRLSRRQEKNNPCSIEINIFSGKIIGFKPVLCRETVITERSIRMDRFKSMNF